MADPLADFIAPITIDAILTKAQRRKMALHAGKCERWDPTLLSWDKLVDMAVKANDIDELRVSVNRNYVPLQFIQSDGAIERAKLEKLIERGASIILESTHRHDERLGEIVREFIDKGGKPMWLGAIGSSGDTGALKRHSDKLDLFIVQMEGAKHWRIYDSEDDAAEPVFEHTLREGDYLFMPANSLHECDTIGGNSLHLGMGFAGPTYKVWG